MKVVASFDDGVKEDLILADMMKQYGIKTTFYFPGKPLEVNEPNGRVSLNKAERRQIAKDHEIGSHTMTHPLLTRIPYDKAVSEIVVSKEFLEHEFSRQITAFCYPRGYANPELQQAVKDAGYHHARGVTVGYLDQSENEFYEQTTVHVGCNRKEYAGMTWYEYALHMFDFAQAHSKAVYHLWGHGWEIAKEIQNFDLLRGLCDKLTKGTS